jgi:hypothetical protein
MMRNVELQRDKEFASHVCADHSKNHGFRKSAPANWFAALGRACSE